MLDRRLDTIIERHFATNRAALLLTGARQTGKTFALRKYAARHGKNLIEINFLEDEAARSIFTGASNAKELLLRISAYTRKRTSLPETLIFFDEVQRCPEIITWVKFLVDEGSCQYALSGSLLGVELNDIRSVPVGYMSVVEVYPLDFEDFALAVGMSAEVHESLRCSWEERRPVDDVVHNSLVKLVQLYLVVGGMPAAVQAYIDTNDLNVVEEKQREILTMFRWDISQYDTGRTLKIRGIFDIIPSELDAKNKRFVMKNLNERARLSRYEDSFLWLKDAGVALPTYNVTEPTFPLRLNEQRNLFKLFLCDVGLLTSCYASGAQLRLLSGDVNINNGAIYENFVAQELMAHGFGTFYFTSKKQGELDFVIEHDGHVVPIEVKSGKDYDRHNALRAVVADEHYAIRQAYVLCNGNIETRGSVTYVPIYMTMFLRKFASPSPQIFVPDLTGLR